MNSRGVAPAKFAWLVLEIVRRNIREAESNFCAIGGEMIRLVFALLLIVGVGGFFTSYTMFGGTIQVAVIIALVVLGIHRIRRYKVD